jgi:hypothetical protein
MNLSTLHNLFWKKKYRGLLNCKKLSDASNAYEAAFSQLAKDKRNILNRIEELSKIGANAKKQLLV